MCGNLAGANLHAVGSMVVVVRSKPQLRVCLSAAPLHRLFCGRHSLATDSLAYFQGCSSPDLFTACGAGDTDYHDAVEFHEGEASLTRSHSSADGSHYTGSPNGSYSAAHAHEPQTVFERVANWWEERKAANAEQQAAAAAAAVAGSPAEAAPHSPASHPLRSLSLGSAPSPASRSAAAAAFYAAAAVY